MKQISKLLEELKKKYNQKELFNKSIVRKNILDYISVILEDRERFNAYYKKRFPRFFKYLFLVKFVALVFIYITLYIDYQTCSSLYYSIVEEKSLIPNPTFYSYYSFFFYFVIIICEFVLAVYVCFKANSPIQNKIFVIVQQSVRVVIGSSVLAVGFSYSPIMESNVVSNFVHTKTPLGRGYDYTTGSLNLRIKGDLVSGALGKDMMNAVRKHASDSNIIDTDKLNNIINDPEFKSKIRLNTSMWEKAFLKIPLLDFSIFSPNETSLPPSSLPTTSEFSDSDSLKDDNNNMKENNTPDIKKLPLKKHHSEPLPQKDNKSIIQRRNTH
jgi:hypothetical protein